MRRADRKLRRFVDGNLIYYFIKGKILRLDLIYLTENHLDLQMSKKCLH